MTVTVSGHDCVLADGVKETSTTVGAGTYALDGAVPGSVSFATGIGNGNKTLYRAQSGTGWEIGVGTVATGSPPTLARTEIRGSSNSGNAVSWTGTTIDIAVVALAELLDQIAATPVVDTKVTTFTSDGTFTTDSKCLFARVRMVGGGGSGGDALSTGVGEAAEGGGGGGGEYAEGRFTAAQLGASKAVTIGAGGLGSTNTAGGTTSLGALLTAAGGGAGANGTATNANASALNGDGGTGGSGGYLRFRGSDGGRGIVRSGAAGLQGSGGSSHFSGERSPTVGGAGENGRLYGGGGAGASIAASTATQAGGNGADGIVIIEEFLTK